MPRVLVNGEHRRLTSANGGRDNIAKIGVVTVDLERVRSRPDERSRSVHERSTSSPSRLLMRDAPINLAGNIGRASAAGSGFLLGVAHACLSGPWMRPDFLF